MKKRQGFISNSSSTSFIISIPKHIANDNIRLAQYFNISGEDSGKCIEVFKQGREVLSKANLIDEMLSAIHYLHGHSYEIEWDNVHEMLITTPTTSDQKWINGKPDCDQKLLDEYIEVTGKIHLGKYESSNEHAQLEETANLLSFAIATDWVHNWLKKNNITPNTHNIYIIEHDDKTELSAKLEEGYLYKNIDYLYINHH